LPRLKKYFPYSGALEIKKRTKRDLQQQG